MRIKLGGVPEHFNYLWKWSYTQELFRKAGHYLEWTDFKGGTGAMIESLEKDEIDVAIMLTEGAIAAIDKGHDFKIRLPFVISPLIWGVFSSTNRVDPLPDGYKNAKFAVSRLFSGSHLMSQFLASKYGSHLTPENFVVSENLKGAIAALESGKADFFLWEKYMTLNLVEERIFNYNGQVTAPWPAFVFVSKTDKQTIEKESLKELVDGAIKNFLSWDRTEAISEISQHFGLRQEDTKSWFDEVRYYDGNKYWIDRILAAQYLMQANDMCETIHPLEELCDL
jgi:sulfonate transport system substrate-binding protein